MPSTRRGRTWSLGGRWETLIAIFLSAYLPFTLSTLSLTEGCSCLRRALLWTHSAPSSLCLLCITPPALEDPLINAALSPSSWSPSRSGLTRLLIALMVWWAEHYFMMFLKHRLHLSEACVVLVRPVREKAWQAAPLGSLWRCVCV